MPKTRYPVLACSTDKGSPTYPNPMTPTTAVRRCILSNKVMHTSPRGLKVPAVENHAGARQEQGGVQQAVGHGHRLIGVRYMHPHRRLPFDVQDLEIRKNIIDGGRDGLDHLAAAALGNAVEVHREMTDDKEAQRHNGAQRRRA